MERNTRMLITGAKGMLGQNLCEVLTDAGFQNLLTPSSAELDLRDMSEVKAYVQKHKPKSLFHLAARVGGIKANMLHPAEFLRDNLLMDSAVMGAAHEAGIEKVIVMGSSCMYPRLCPQPMKEEMLLTGVPEPTNEGYAIAKIAVAKLCQYHNVQYGMNCLALIAPNLYGIHERFDPDHSHVISSLIMKFHAAVSEGRKSVEMWGTGSARREFLFARDMAEGLLWAMENLNASDLDVPYINVGSGSDVSILELADIMRSISGFDGEIIWDTTKPDGMPQKLMDSSRATERGWKAKTSLQDGIRQTYDYYRSLQS
jgi:GDP-L-fucose synthase